MVFPPRRHLCALQRSSPPPHHHHHHHHHLLIPLLLQLHSLLLKTALDHFRPLLAAKPVSPHALLSPPPLFSLNSLLRFYASSRSPLQSLRLFAALRRVGLRPDNFTYPFALRACGRTSALGSGAAVHGLVVKVGFCSDSYVGNTLLYMYAGCGVAAFARKVFDEMGVRDVVSWSSVIQGYVACNQPAEAMMMFYQMRLSNVLPNSVTLISLLSASTQLGDLRTGRSIHSLVSVNNIKLDVPLGTALIRMYSKCGRIENAFHLFNTVKEKNLQTWAIMISGFADHGRAQEALNLFSEMEAVNIKPDSTLFSIILSACSHLGLVDEGQKYFNRMVNELISNQVWSIMVVWRAGLVEAAYELIRNMPMAPNSIILRSFLWACKKHGELCGLREEMNQLMNLLLEKEPGLGSNYVIAAHVSALSSKWNDVAKLRGSIGEKDLKKAAGCSWMEANC
ncbi:Pentatricopeptide repeat-containing protein, partial [Ananas comosus]